MTYRYFQLGRVSFLTVTLEQYEFGVQCAALIDKRAGVKRAQNSINDRSKPTFVLGLTAQILVQRAGCPVRGNCIEIV